MTNVPPRQVSVTITLVPDRKPSHMIFNYNKLKEKKNNNTHALTSLLLLHKFYISTKKSNKFCFIKKKFSSQLGHSMR